MEQSELCGMRLFTRIFYDDADLILRSIYSVWDSASGKGEEEIEIYRRSMV